MTQASDAVSADTFAHGLTQKALDCRDRGHVWRPRAVEVIQEGRSLGGYLRTFVCQCRTERHQMLDSQGRAVGNRYVYPDGYLASHVERGFGREVFRLESVNRWLESHADTTERKAG